MDSYGNIIKYLTSPLMGDLVICTKDGEYAVFEIDEIKFVLGFSPKTNNVQILKYCQTLRKAGFVGNWEILSLQLGHKFEEEIFYLRDCPLINTYGFIFDEINFGNEKI